MSAAAKNEKSVSGDSPVCGKSRGNRLARRARSFKEDFLEILSQMRSPGGSATRSASPCSPKARSKAPGCVDNALEKNPAKDLECNIRQAQLALKHFRDVVNKNKLEILPGNGTVVLETVTAIHVLLKKYVLNEQSSTLVSATNQVYQSVAKLIKLCDDYLLIGEKALGKENVSEIINFVEDAIHNLVSLAKDKLILRDSNYKLATEATSNHVKHKSRALTEKNSLELVQRSSLPDIPLTPREREILERTSAFVLERHSQSTENVLGDAPPPKPPHPDRVNLETSFPPPLPPKKRHKHLDDVMAMKNSMECLSLRSKSPEDSSSLLSASAGSLDSVLNHCRDEEGAVVDLTDADPHHCNSLGENCFLNGYSRNFFWECSSPTAKKLPLVNPEAVFNSAKDQPVSVPEEILTDGGVEKSDRLSGSQTESGISSMRSSSQSCSASSQHMSSARSSQQSYTSQEFHHSEKKSISTTESSTQQNFHSFTIESSHNETSEKAIFSNTSENVSFQKQTIIKRRTDISSSGTEMVFLPNTSSNKPSEDFPGCHHEVKLQECPHHSSFLPSPSESLQSYKRCSPDQGHVSVSSDDDRPPALPEKIRCRKKKERHPSQYDNLNEGMCTVETSEERNCFVSTTYVDDNIVSHDQSSLTSSNTVNVSTLGGTASIVQLDRVDGSMIACKSFECGTGESVQSTDCSVFQSMDFSSSDGNPPPLPPKKKHIMAYMEIFGNASHANSNEFLRHSVHAYNLLQNEWQQHQKLLTSAQSCSLTFACDSIQSTPVRKVESKSEAGLPPALPPKKRTRSSTSSPPQTPTLIIDLDNEKGEECVEVLKEIQNVVADDVGNGIPPEKPGKDSLEDNLSAEAEKEGESSLLDKLNISDHLVLKKKEDEGPDIRGGHPDALIVHATKAHKNEKKTDFLYQEAFLTTYRTFMTPLELIQKLCYRHEKFSSCQDTMKQRAARESFSLLVRVVSDLTLTDLDQVVLQTLMEFTQQLLCRGDLTMAKALRVIMLSKYEAKKLYLNTNNLLPSHNIYTRQSLLLDFKSDQVAEQMTLLDAELFLKIEIPEVLIWAQEQNEERSPNLTKFTEHFNKMSYWARSRILEQSDAKDREKYVIKFIKIMKHLRKINNFNSYLALLSALDSAPIRRLEWQKHITEGLKEYCALIDSSSSFRAYRQALAETNPPCIPYIGLVLQDLTFVHIGNTNNLPSGEINFSKRWQQFNIVENMKRFKKGSYPYKKNEKIIAFFNGFDDSLSEEAMWQISEKIKPRGGKKT